MNADVNERLGRTLNRVQQKPRESNALFSRIRNFTSLFTNAANISGDKDSRFEYDEEDTNGQSESWDAASELQLISNAPQQYHHNNQSLAPPIMGLDVDTPTPTRPTTPRNNNTHSNPSDRGIFNQSRCDQHRTYYRDFHNHRDYDDGDQGGIALSDIESHALVPSSSSATVFSSFSSHSSSSSVSSIMISDLDDTPPLSPDGRSSIGGFPSILSLSEELEFAMNEEAEQFHPDDSIYRSKEIKEGKKPERAVCYDTLIDDLAGNDFVSTSNYQTNNRPPIDDADEWYGLEYTLELSCKERRPSETYSYDESVGESSRSRESWAALRRGTIHPFFEDEDYYHWKNWHRHLDREDERRKHRKGLEFRARSKDMAWLYLNEMKTREVMYWQLEVYGMIARDVRDRLAMLAEHRRDPYYPAKKHNLGWYLKRSRSAACLRELQPKPTPKLISRGGGRLVK